MKHIDEFEFLPTKTDAQDEDHGRWIDVLSPDWGGTAYEHKLPDAYVTNFEVSGTAGLLLPAVQSVRERGTTEQSAHDAHNTPAMDLIDWAFDQIA